MSNTTNQSGPKRPYATLDLKATEIKVSKIGQASATADTVKPEAVPLPLPASAYAMAAPAAAHAGTANPDARASTSPSAAQTAATARAPSEGAASAGPAPKTAARSGGETVIVKKRGGFVSHLAASLIGGAVALGGWAYGLPELQKQGLIPAIGNGDTSSVAERIAKLEAAAAAKLDATESRLAALEKSSDAIGELKEAQSRLVAETKAALASAASDAGAPDQIERLTAVENHLKSMADAGASDPNAGRLEQIAALTGKVADLETSLATQLTALRKSVSGDVEARVVSANEAAEAAKSGMQRIDRDMASLKTESVKLDERVATLKAEIDRAAEQNKLRQDEFARLKVALDEVKAGAAKHADVTSAIAPVTAKIAAIEQGLKDVTEAEAARQSNAERVVLALELQNLKRALDRGQKYDVELAEVEKAARSTT